MTVRELRSYLEGIDDETEVRIASFGHRSHFEHHIGDIQPVQVTDEFTEETKEVVYIEEAGQIGYLPGEVHEVFGQ